MDPVTTALTLLPFAAVWLVDFEFSAPPGERPSPICVVAKEMRTGKVVRMWDDELRRASAPPYPTDADSLFVSYYASAEMGCHLALGWPMPVRVLDLFAEFRNATNGRPPPCGAGLLGALTYYGLPGAESVDKESMRALALRGGPFTDDEGAVLLAYCESDVLALERLLQRMLPNIDLPRALLRGRYMRAAARMEHVGVPMDVEALATIREFWPRIRIGLIADIDASYGVYDGQSFSAERWGSWLAQRGIPWPRLPSGALALDEDTFKQMANGYREVQPIHELRKSLATMRLEDLAVGADRRNRCLLSAFRARTGRNQPSNTRFAFGPSRWLRYLIKPEPGSALAYIDWSAQEIGIAAALSGDDEMMEHYAGDPYLSFAKRVGAIPPDGTKETHEHVRDLYKAVCLGVLYGMGVRALAERTGRSPAVARDLLAQHQQVYRRFWRWSDAAVAHAMLLGHLKTTFGWTIHVGENPNPRALRNYPVQANGSEMLRLACCLATERGIAVCAPIHDALLVEAPLANIDEVVAATQASMAEASEIVLGGFRLRSEAKVVRYPDRYGDKRGSVMWEKVWRRIQQMQSEGCHGLAVLA